MYGLINLAGRQLQPNITASMAFARTGQLALHAILHSDNATDSMLPAVKTLEVLNHDPASHGVQHMRIEVDETVQGVRQTVAELFAEFAHLRWILHATGGNKMMSAALVQLATHPRVECVVYRDLRKGWQTLRPNASAEICELPLQPGCGTEAALLDAEVKLDRLPLLQLVRAQFVDSSNRAELDAHAPLPNAHPLDWIKCVHQDRRRHSFKSYPAAQGLSSDGTAFEAWIASVLLEAGACQVLWNCVARTADATPVLECDVVAVHGDRIAIYNAKIDKPDAPGKTAQIREAAETTKLLGGLSAQCVLLRPNWPPAGAAVQGLAQALNVRLITSQDRSQFVHSLLAPLGLGGALAQHSALAHIQHVWNQIYQRSPTHPFHHSVQARRA